MNLIRELRVNGKDYVFNGKTLELFEIENQQDYEDYLLDDFQLEVPFENKEHSDTLFKVTLNISNSCNLRCKYCYADHGKYGRNSSFMSENTVDKIINDIKQRGFNEIFVVALFGGEPLLNFDVIKYAILMLEREFTKIHNFEITTNGVLLNDEMIDFICAHNIKLVLSIDGPEDVTDFHRGVGVHQNILNIINKLKKRNYKNVEASATYTKKHQELGYTYENIVEYFDALEIIVSISKVSVEKNSPYYIDDSMSMESFRALVESDLEAVIHGQNKILNPYMYRVLCGIIFDMKCFQFCDDLQTNYSLAYDYDGELYNCFRLWGKPEFKVNNELTNLLLVRNNNKDNVQKCRECWARYFCKDCTAEITLGEIDFPVQNGECKTQIMYDVCLEEFVKFIEKEDLNDFVNNFKTYLRYRL